MVKQQESYLTALGYIYNDLFHNQTNILLSQQLLLEHELKHLQTSQTNSKAS